MKTPRDLPVGIWREPVDDDMRAGLVCCVVFKGGWVRAFGTMLLYSLEQERAWGHWGAWREKAYEHFIATLTSKYGGRLPDVCRIADWPKYDLGAYFFANSKGAP